MRDFPLLSGLANAPVTRDRGGMGIDSETDQAASLQIGPTSEGMVRIYIEGEGIDLPMDFDPEEAEEIANELRAAAQRARGAGSGKKKRKR